jgi:hypothetical protein
MKKINLDHLKLTDLQIHPIWVPIDDFEDENKEITPYEGDIFDFEEMYIIATDFIFANGSAWTGYVRYSLGEMKEMAIAKNEEEFVFLLDSKLIKDKKKGKGVREFLDLGEECIFPITIISKAKVYILSKAY